MDFKTFLKEEAKLDEAAPKANDVLLKMGPDKMDSTKTVSISSFDEKSIIRAAKKLVNPHTRKVMDKSYMDGRDVVHGKSGKTMGTTKVGGTLQQLVTDLDNWAKDNVQGKPAAQTFDVKSDTRVIISATDEEAKYIKSIVHNAKEKVKVRIMTRKDGNKVYIDTADKASLDTAIEKAKRIINS